MHYIYQDGPAVYKFAVRKMAEATTKVLERNGVTGADLGCFIPHQANKRIITATADRLGMDPERVIINIENYGNTSAGTIPLAMETAIEQGKLKKGDLVLLAAVGLDSQSARRCSGGRFKGGLQIAVRELASLLAESQSDSAFLRVSGLAWVI